MPLESRVTCSFVAVAVVVTVSACQTTNAVPGAKPEAPSERRSSIATPLRVTISSSVVGPATSKSDRASKPPVGGIAKPVTLTVAPIIPRNEVARSGKVMAPPSLLQNQPRGTGESGGAGLANGGLFRSGGGGGTLIANNSGGLIAAGKFKIMSASPEPLLELPVEGAQVVVVDATGKPVVGRNGKAIVATTDNQGKFRIAPMPSDRSVVLMVALPGQPSGLTGFVPQDLAMDANTDIGLVSTLVSGYILHQYIQPTANPNQALNQLPAHEYADTQSLAHSAFVETGTESPSSLGLQELITTVDALRQSETFSKQLDKVGGMLDSEDSSGSDDSGSEDSG